MLVALLLLVLLLVVVQLLRVLVAVTVTIGTVSLIPRSRTVPLVVLPSSTVVRFTICFWDRCCLLA